MVQTKKQLLKIIIMPGSEIRTPFRQGSLRHSEKKGVKILEQVFLAKGKPS